MITAVFPEYDKSNTKNIAVNEDMSLFQSETNFNILDYIIITARALLREDYIGII